jgi:hypothetical protein
MGEAIQKHIVTPTFPGECEFVPHERGDVYLASDVDARIAKLERVRLAASRYFENYLLDEAEDRLVCHSDEPHEMAQALRDALNSCSLMESVTK